MSERVDRIGDGVDLEVAYGDCAFCGADMNDEQCTQNCPGWRRDNEKRVERMG